MLAHPDNREPNFIEKRRQWKAGIEKPLSRRSLLAVLPAIALCVFALLAAPYLDDLLRLFVKKGETYELTALGTAELAEPAAKEEPPVAPETGMADFYREKFEREGFDWRQTPTVEGPDLTYAREKPLPIEPLDVELPTTMAELAGPDAVSDAAP